MNPLWRGQAGKTFYLLLWLPLLYVLSGFCFFLAWRAYPKGYRLPDHDISYLGHPLMNPHGWWYWSIAMGLSAVMMYPPIIHASRRMKELTRGPGNQTPRLVALGSYCLRASCLGMLGLALTPQGPKVELIHQTSGFFAMAGMYLTLLVLWPVPLFKRRAISTTRLIILAVATRWAVIGFLATQGYRCFALGELIHSPHEKYESLFLRFSFWEWMLFFGVTGAFYLLIALLPATDTTGK